MRVGLTLAQERLERAERFLYYREARRRLLPAELAECARTEAALSTALTGRTVFVVGTGPSLNQLDLRRLAGTTVIGVNSLFRHSAMSSWQPTFYCLMDENFFTASQESAEYFNDMRRVLPRTRFISTTRVMKTVERHRLLPKDDTFYVAVDGAIDEDVLPLRSFGELLPCAPNSVMFASLAAVLMGAMRIILLGADHDWLVKPNAEQRALDPHFYAQKEAVAPSVTVNTDWNMYRSYLTTIEYCSRVWRGYYVLDAMARERGVEILNATPGSRLDVFAPVAFDEAVRLATAP